MLGNNMRFHIVTLFPGVFESYSKESILARAQISKKISFSFYNPRDFTKDTHKRIDRKPYGGGPGMVMEAEPVLKAVDKARGKKKKVKVVFFSPSGKQFDSAYAKRLAKNYTDIVLIAGHYEGVDARVVKASKADVVSIGPYVLTGGEVPAMVVTDAVARFVPGVLGNIESLEEGRTASPDVYTRPEVFTWKGKKYNVPKVLLSGHHKKIEEWKIFIRLRNF